MMKNWSIQRRVLLIALLPAAVLAVLLSAYSAYQQIHAAERRAIEHARAVAAEIAPVAGHAALAGKDDALLEGLTNTLITERSAIAAIILRDRADSVLLRTQRDDTPASENGGAVRITHPIRGPSSTDRPITTVNDSESLGTVEIAVNLARVRREQMEPLLEGLVLTTFALGLTALVAVGIGRSVTDPVHDLVRGIERIRSEEYGYRKTPDSRTLRRAPERALEQSGQGGGPPSWQPCVNGRSADSLPGKVLVVDDQPANLKLLESFLEGTGWETVSATGSDEALYHARLTRFDAILMDIHLPERDGIETSVILRMAGELNAHTPILAITADAFADQAHAAIAAGINDILVKPVSRTALLERLAQWCWPGAHDIGATDSRESTAAHAPVPPAYYDPEDARTRAGGWPGVADELFVMLCRHLPSSRAELRSAHDQNDAQALLAAAHRLKGAAAYCGVPRLRHELTVLEERVRRGDTHAIALDAVCSTIDALLQMDRSDTSNRNVDSA